MQQESLSRQEYDAWWKLFLQQFLKEFLELVAPDLYALINWGTPIELLDKELLPLAANSRTRRLFVDCLFRVRLKSG